MPGVVLEEMVVKYVADLTGYERGAQRVRDLNSQLTGAIGREFDALGSKLTGSAGMFGRVAAGLGPFGIALGVVGGITVSLGAGLAALTVKGDELGSRLHDLSLQTGLNVETLSGLQSQLKQSGTDVDALGNSVLFLHKNLGKAAEGNKELKATFKELGIKDVDAALRDTDGTFRTVIKSLGKLTDEGNRDRLGTEALGRGYKDLRVFIADTGGDIDAVMKLARESGLVMGEEVAGNLDDLGDAWDRLDHKTQVMGANFAGVVAPELTKALNDISAFLSANLVDWNEWAAGAANEIAFVRGAAEGVAKFWNSGSHSIVDLGKQMGEGGVSAMIGAQTDYFYNQAHPKQPKPPSGGIGLTHGGGSGGGGSKKPKDLSSLYEQLSDAEGGRRLAGVNFFGTQFKAQLDGEQSVLDAAFKAQLVSVKEYWKSRNEITLVGMDYELNQLRTEQKIAGESYKTKYETIGKDKKLSSAERTIKQQEESAKWAEKNYQLEGQIAQATERRAAAAQTITFESAAAARDLEKTMVGLKADYLESSGDSVGAAYKRIADKFKELHDLARANKDMFPDADKMVASLEHAEKLTANLARLGERLDLGKGYLGLETAQIQDKITDGVVSEREGRRQIYELELKYRDALQGILGESLAIAKARGDEKAILSIQQQIKETERLAHVIDDTRAKTRGVFEDAFTHGLDELTHGLKHAAATFGQDLLESIRREANQKLAKQLGQLLFGKNDEFGSDSGLVGKVLKKIGLGGLLGNKAASPEAVTASNTTATNDNTIAIENLTQAINANAFGSTASGSLDDGANGITEEIQKSTTSIDQNIFQSGLMNVNAIHELGHTLIAMQPQPQSFGKQLLMTALGSLVGAFGGSLGAHLSGGSGGASSSGAGGETHTGSYVLDDNGNYTRPRRVGPPHAAGGPVEPGVAYPVGERGVELFMPHAPGMIIPNHQLGGSQTIHNYHRTVVLNYQPRSAPDSFNSRRGDREVAEGIVNYLR